MDHGKSAAWGKTHTQALSGVIMFWRLCEESLEERAKGRKGCQGLERKLSIDHILIDQPTRKKKKSSVSQTSLPVPKNIDPVKDS